MGEWLEYLNDNAGAFNVVFTAVVALATGVYAVLTVKLVQETRNLREAQTEPRIEVFFRSYEEWISLIGVVVKNIGAGPAYELRFDCSAVAKSEGADALLKRLHELNSIQSGIGYLGPGQEFSAYWTNMTEEFEKKIDVKLIIRSVYRSAMGRPYSREHHIDFSELKGLGQIGDPFLLRIARALEKSREDFQHIASGFKKLQIDVFDAEDRDAEQKRVEEHLEKIRAKRAAQAKPEEGKS